MKTNLKITIVASVVVLIAVAIAVAGFYYFRPVTLELERPEWEPDISVDVYDADLMQPGVTVFGLNPKAGQANNIEIPSYFAYDENGELAWYYYNSEDVPAGNRDLEVLPDGNYLIHIENGFRVITPAGKTVMNVTADEFGYDEFHHDVTFTDAGTFIAMATEIKQMETTWADRKVGVKGEVLVEINDKGEVIWEWNSFDHLDTNRLPLKQEVQKKNSVYDWLHANSVQYYAPDDSLVVSFRHQSWVIKIDHQTGEVLWKLGRDGDFELVNRNSDTKVAWFSAQHAPELHSDGTILIYDNGNERGWTNELFSRAVIYQLDDEKMEARQIWQYQTDYYTDFVGDVDLLENGNILVTAGGQRNSPGPAQIIEVTPDNPSREVWKMEIPGFDIFRATRISDFINSVIK